jgi:hypothetical protein
MAIDVTNNLMKVLNMEENDDNKALKQLVENLKVAEEIGMRGELIDVALTFKILCTKYLEDMVKHAG